VRSETYLIALKEIDKLLAPAVYGKVGISDVRTSDAAHHSHGGILIFSTSMHWHSKNDMEFVQGSPGIFRRGSRAGNTGPTIPLQVYSN
jgi:hypothetical protein